MVSYVNGKLYRKCLLNLTNFGYQSMVAWSVWTRLDGLNETSHEEIRFLHASIHKLIIVLVVFYKLWKRLHLFRSQQQEIHFWRLLKYKKFQQPLFSASGVVRQKTKTNTILWTFGDLNP